MSRKKNKSKGFRMPCGYLAAGGILDMIVFCHFSSHPKTVFYAGAFVVLFAIVWAFLRHECKRPEVHIPWWWF